MRVSVEEKLAAILVADVADYERRSERDRGRSRPHCSSITTRSSTPRSAIYGGRIFELEPDHTLAEFASPLAAVRCAVEMQERLERRALGVPPAVRACGCASASTTAQRWSIAAS